jgi:hypothetical protein
MTLQTCRLCLKKKQLETEFYRSRSNRTGFDKRCKECHAATSRLRKRITYNLEKKRQNRRKLIIENPNYYTDRARRERASNPLKYRARYTLQNAVRDGRVTRKPCIKCGNRKSQGHHNDYSKPLHVLWLCSRHHGQHHRKPDLVNKLKEEEV